MTQFVKVKVLVAGQHRWPEAPDGVAFLRHPHRHVFKVEAEVEVTHADRAVEFFTAQDDLEAFLRARFPGRFGPLVDFGERSCEMIAAEVLAGWGYGPRRVVVWEDGENAGGAER